jgi:hypothetical protein
MCMGSGGVPPLVADERSVLLPCRINPGDSSHSTVGRLSPRVLVLRRIFFAHAGKRAQTIRHVVRHYPW